MKKERMDRTKERRDRKKEKEEGKKKRKKTVTSVNNAINDTGVRLNQIWKYFVLHVVTLVKLYGNNSWISRNFSRPLTNRNPQNIKKHRPSYC